MYEKKIVACIISDQQMSTTMQVLKNVLPGTDQLLAYYNIKDMWILFFINLCTKNYKARQLPGFNVC
jgi:hypothetical protein